MRTRRIHVFGASGAGVTTLGRALADRLAIPHHDTDDYFWLPTSPPYRTQRAVPDRLRLVHEMFLQRDAWVLSGSLDGWGGSLATWFDVVAFVYAPTAIRLRRLRDREARHFGRDAVSPGGWRYQETEDFIEWAAHYDDATREGRTLPRHQAWLHTLPCPVLRLDGTLPVPELLEQVIRTLD
jgi:adenylate kinase family enzyme